MSAIKLAIKEGEWITFFFFEVIKFLYCSGAAWIHWPGKWNSWQGGSPRTGSCPGTVGLGSGGGVLPPAQPRMEGRKLLGGCARA